MPERAVEGTVTNSGQPLVGGGTTNRQHIYRILRA
jgi:hypothetical protein